jgi:hypothetical protein
VQRHRVDPGDDLVVGPLRDHRHDVVDEAVRVVHEQPAGQVVVGGAAQERRDDPAVPAGQSRAGAHRRRQPGELLAAELPDRPALHDQVRGGHPVGVQIDVQAVVHVDREPPRRQEGQEQLGGLDRDVPFPATADN